MLSFRNRLLILLIGLVVGAQTVTLFTSLASTRKTVLAGAREQLTAGVRNAQNQLDSNERVLAVAVSVLGSDDGLRQAVATGNKPTVASALANHARRIHADLSLALDLDGTLIARGEGTAPLEPELVSAVAASEAGGVAGAQFVVTPSGVHQVFTAPVLAPDEIGSMAFGFTVDTTFAQDLHGGIGVDVAFLRGAGDDYRVVASTLKALQNGDFTPRTRLGNEPAVATIGGQEYLAAVLDLETRGPPLQLALLKPMSQVMAPYRALAWNFALIIGLTLAAAVLAGIYLGGTAARPVLQLAAGAARIAQGDYSAPVEGSSGGRELANLAQAFNTMQSGIAERETRLRHQARHDSTTNLPNRLFAEEWLTEELSVLGADAKLGVVWLAVANLPEVSARLGFDIAAQLVRHLASNIGNLAGEHTLVARADATHFIVAATPLSDRALEQLLTDLRERARRPLTTAGITLQASVVMGAALAPLHGENANELLRCAEAALETAQQQNQWHSLFERASDAAQRRALQLGADLPQALQSGQLHLLYQPKFRVSDRTPRGVEALVRWQHPEFGNVSPAEFVPIAERTGASGLLTRWVLREALTQLAAWQRAGIQVEMAVNLSAADIVDPGMLEYILGALRDARLAAHALMLEITESVLLHEPEIAKRNMELLRVAGVRFSIDDFGTGYSSLSQLRELAADELKIDMSFVRVMTQGTEHVAVIRAIVDLGRGLGLRTVAEGVEEEAQWKLLVELGCDYVQGYLTGRPQSPADLTPQLRAASSVAADGESQTASLRVLELRRRE
jgi:EAL domain-containing protein (putative c-di-GMP-specific phosphodiesterase class I)/GGDEF domain-containing protein